MIAIVIVASVTLFASFLCSILEAVLLSARLPMLLERSRNGDEGATRLLAIQRDQIDQVVFGGTDTATADPRAVDARTYKRPGFTIAATN